MLRTLTKLPTFLTTTVKAGNINNLINTRRDSYNAIHVTPLESIDNNQFQSYMTTLLNENT